MMYFIGSEIIVYPIGKAIYKLFILDALDLILHNKQLGLYVNKYKGKQIVGTLNLGNDFIGAYRQLSSVNDNMDINTILSKNLSEIRNLDYTLREEKKTTLEININNKYDEIVKYYQDRDVSKISFWGVHANLAIKQIKGL